MRFRRINTISPDPSSVVALPPAIPQRQCAHWPLCSANLGSFSAKSSAASASSLYEFRAVMWQLPLAAGLAVEPMGHEESLERSTATSSSERSTNMDSLVSTINIEINLGSSCVSRLGMGPPMHLGRSNITNIYLSLIHTCTVVYIACAKRKKIKKTVG